MKALIIAEDDSTIKAVSPVVKSCGYELIIYRWLLKALDNVEEIAPDMVLISTAEYPRHWKTFIQFTQSGIGGVVPKIILYNSRAFNEDDEAKAKALGVCGIFSSLDQSGLDMLKKFLTVPNTPSATPQKIEFAFTNPYNRRFVSGTVKSADKEKIKFIPDIKDSAENLKIGDTIQNATYGSNKNYKQVCAKISAINDDVFELTLA